MRIKVWVHLGVTRMVHEGGLLKRHALGSSGAERCIFEISLKSPKGDCAEVGVNLDVMDWG